MVVRIVSDSLLDNKCKRDHGDIVPECSNKIKF